MPNYVPGYGPFKSKIMIVAEAPGQHENEAQIPLVGPTGQLAQEIVRECGGRWDEIYKTNVVKYQPPFNDLKKLHLITDKDGKEITIADSTAKLWEQEINIIRPNVIIALGDTALNAVTGLDGIMNYRGSILLANNGLTKVVPTIHPAALFPKKGQEQGPLPWVYKKLITSDIQRAIDESHTAILSLPDRALRIASNSLDVFRFFQEYLSVPKTGVDIESINCVPVSIAFAFNPHHSLTIPLITKVGDFPLTDMSKREIAECWKLIQETLLSKGIIGQNFKYDEYKLSRIGIHCGKLVSDVLLKTHTIFPELPTKGLATQTSLWTREPFYKDDGKENKIGKRFDVERFFRYNGRDSCVTVEIDEAEETDLVSMAESLKIPLVDFYYNYVMRKHKFYFKMENVGFKVDLERQKELKVKYAELQAKAHVHLTNLVGYDVNVKSPQQVHRLLYEAMKFPKMKKAPTAEDTIVGLLGNHCKGSNANEKKQILEGLLEERRIRDQLSRYINFTPDYDNRCKTSVKISGTETSRTSTNILKKPIRPKKIGLSFHTISKHGRLAKDIRSMFIPDDDMVFISVDSSQAEARIVAVLCEDYDLLTAFDTIDIHRRTAGLLIGYLNFLDLRPIDLGIVDHIDKDGPERFSGKKVRHAGNYDMKKRRLMMEFNTDAQKFGINMQISEWRAGQMLDLFHNASPKIRAVFHESIKRALDNTRLLINPFGRPRIFNAKFDEDLYKEGYAFIPQSTVADLVQGAAIKADDEFNGDINIQFLTENHDALVAQVPKNNWEPYARVIIKHMEAPIDFSRYCTLKRDFQLVIPAEAEYSDTNYAKFTKVKLDKVA